MFLLRLYEFEGAGWCACGARGEREVRARVSAQMT